MGKTNPNPNTNTNTNTRQLFEKLFESLLGWC